MKKMFLIALVGVLLLCLCGCVASEPGNNDLASQPNESTTPSTDVIDVPEETTVPTAITDPADVATHGNLNPGPWGVALSPATLAESGFEQWRGEVGEYYQYGYVGKDNTVAMPGGGVTITFPQDWIENLIIVWHRDSEDTNWVASVSSGALIRAWAAYREDIAPENVEKGMLAEYAGINPIIMIVGIPNNVTNYIYLPEQYLGRDESYTYVISTPDGWAKQSEYWRYREDMIEVLGEDTYNDLLGGMVITEEMAKEMITITNPVED